MLRQWIGQRIEVLTGAADDILTNLILEELQTSAEERGPDPKKLYILLEGMHSSDYLLSALPSYLHTALHHPSKSKDQSEMIGILTTGSSQEECCMLGKWEK